MINCLGRWFQYCCPCCHGLKRSPPERPFLTCVISIFKKGGPKKFSAITPSSPYRTVLFSFSKLFFSPASVISPLIVILPFRRVLLFKSILPSLSFTLIVRSEGHRWAL